MSLIGDGLHVECLPRALHIVDLDDPEHRIDLFHCFFDAEGRSPSPSVSREPPPSRPRTGRGSGRSSSWVSRGRDPGRRRTAGRPPVRRRLATPQARVQLDIDRTGVGPRGGTSASSSGRGSTGPTSTAATTSTPVRRSPGSCSSIPALPEWLVDIGCGDGRDACALGAAGRTVLGIDASAEGVGPTPPPGQRSSRSTSACPSWRATCLTDRRLRQHLEELRGRARDRSGSTCASSSTRSPSTSRRTCSRPSTRSARPGDVLLAEFRTVEDKQAPKTHGKHYRRFLDAARLRDELRERFRFDADYFVEGRGLSPYGDEDPVLCRVVARRGDA